MMNKERSLNNILYQIYYHKIEEGKEEGKEKEKVKLQKMMNKEGALR
jgi:hypothetical protein